MDNENQTVIEHCSHFPAPKLARKCAIAIDQLYVQIQEHTILHVIAQRVLLILDWVHRTIVTILVKLCIICIVVKLLFLVCMITIMCRVIKYVPQVCPLICYHYVTVSLYFFLTDETSQLECNLPYIQYICEQTFFRIFITDCHIFFIKSSSHQKTCNVKLRVYCYALDNKIA